jgi:hypothetical protein
MEIHVLLSLVLMADGYAFPACQARFLRHGGIVPPQAPEGELNGVLADSGGEIYINQCAMKNYMVL